MIIWVFFIFIGVFNFVMWSKYEEIYNKTPLLLTAFIAYPLKYIFDSENRNKLPLYPMIGFIASLCGFIIGIILKS
jgi:hypothetical protein